MKKKAELNQDPILEMQDYHILKEDPKSMYKNIKTMK